MDMGTMNALLAQYLAPATSTVLWIGISCGLLLMSTLVYTAITPYHEFRMIRSGNIAAMLSLAGVVIGFTLTLISVVLNARNVVDMTIWALIALVIQLVAFVLVSLVMPHFRAEMEKGNAAAGGLLGTVALVVGMLTAACLVP